MFSTFLSFFQETSSSLTTISPITKATIEIQINTVLVLKTGIKYWGKGTVHLEKLHTLKVIYLKIVQLGKQYYLKR